MKRLLLVRHAKSSWKDAALADSDRPLNGRGKRDAPRMGKKLSGRGMKPDLILSSPATRALVTARIIAKELGYRRKHIVVDDRLYPGEADDLLEVIHGLDDDQECVLLFGHNPGLSDLAHRFAKEPANMPTCAVAEFVFDAASWPQIGSADLVSWRLDRPKRD